MFVAHALLQCKLATPPSKGGVLFPFLESGQALNLLWLIEYNGSDAVYDSLSWIVKD